MEKNLKKLKRLKDSALESCNFRGHSMGKWETTKNYHREGRHISTCYCMVCNKYVQVDTIPDPNGIDICGPAVALSCSDSDIKKDKNMEKTNYNGRVIETPYVSIETKYIPASTHKGSRVKAFTRGSRPHSVTIGYDYHLSTFDAHKKAAVALCEKLEWQFDMIAGGTDKGYVFVLR